MIKKITIFISILILLTYSAFSQAGLNVSGNSTLFLSSNAKLSVKGNVQLETSSQFTQSAGDSIVVSGNWTNNGTMTPNGGVTLFNSNANQTIGGSSESKFYDVSVNKSSGNILLTDDISVERNLRLLSNTLVDISDDTLTIGESGNIFTDNGTAAAFTNNRSIYTSLGINSGFLRKKISSAASLPYNFRFPLSTNGTPSRVYTFADVTLIAGKVTIGSNAFIQVKAVTTEHPALQLANNALKKYWVIEPQNITISNQGANLLFKYHQSEVTTNEGNYQVLEYSPPYPDGGAQWFVNPGASNQVVDINADLIYSEQVSRIRGDWTAGIEEAAIATYYSRANGDFDDPNTWSKLGFGGAASTTIPNNGSDRARIKNNTVTVDANSNTIGNISIEENSTIVFVGENYLSADSIIVKDDAVLRITSANGIDNGNTIGNLRSTSKSISENVVFIYEGTDSLQYSGNGLPASARSIILNKATSNRILEMNDFVSIKDSLIINDGILDIGAYSVNGASANRKLTMRGGELRIRNAFPTNYSAPYFTAGLINFFGSGAATVPTNITSPAVLQYNKLELSGNRSGNITFPSNGQIKIADSLKISNLDFSSTTYKFLTSGSTVVFNKNGGNQYIPIKPNSPTDSASYLNYHNLIIDSTGNKLLKDSGTPLYVLKGNLTLRNQSTFNLNGFNLSVQGNWINQDAGSIFVPGTNTVLMNSPVTASTTNITSRDTTENPFYNLVITGKGIVRPLDELKIRNNIRIDSNSTLLHQATNITLSGNWLNYKGTYTTNNANLYLNGTALQTISKPNADENFDKLILRNPNGVDVSNIGTTINNGLNLNGNVTLESGNIITGNRRVTTLANVIRPGGNPGHINGTQWKSIPTGASTTLYEVGTATSYTPVNFTVDSTAGSAGFVAVKADTITGATSPVTVGLNPANSLMSDSKNIRRQWTISVPSTSTFALVDRTYTAQLNYIATNDLRNSANPNFFEARLWNGSAWVFPKRLGNPYIGSRTASSIKFFKTKQFGTFITGEPSNYSFYSIANGNWSTPSNWSTERFGGAATTIEPTTDGNVYIGDNKRINLITDKTNNLFVSIDSTGIINFTANNSLQGTGEFRLNQFGKMEIEHFQGITTAPNVSGAVQMSIRNYNYNNHKRGIFEYKGTSNQFIGDGLPDNTYRLIMNKPSNSLTFNQPSKVILDSLYLKSGDFSYNTSFTIQGNLRRSAGVSFGYTSTPIIEFSGDSTQYINDENTDSLRLYSVRIDKNSGNLVLENNSPLDIVDQLRFQGSNNGIIYARKPGNYVIVRGTVNRFGNGHVNGELIKNIPAGDASEVTFEVGDTLYYSPFYLDMRGGSGSTAGFLAMNALPGDYPYMGDEIITTTNPPVYPGRIIHRYWRLSKPAWSTFVRGARNFDIRSEYRDSEDWEALDSYECADFAFNKYFDDNTRDTTDWESIWPSNAGICSDTRDMSRTPRFANTFGNGTTGNVFTDVNNITKDWGTSKTLPNGSLLLGDFVLGNQNGKAQFITFYSRQSGNWTDPNTWSTVSHLSNINVADTISPTINFRKFPLRQYDNVLIDSNHKVTLDASIGMGEYTATGSPARYLAKVGPNVLVKPKGILDLDIFDLRGNSFKAEKGATVIIGSSDGVNNTSPVAVRGLGNLKGYARAIEDSVNFVYTAEGINPDNPNRSFPYYHNYCTINMGDNSRYIRRVTVSQGATTIMNNNTGDSLINILSFHDYVAELTAGQTYTLEVERESSSGNRDLKAFIDWNRDGDWTDATEQIASTSFNTNIQSVNFTVPASTPEGSTQMRVIYRSNSSNNSPCANSNGEAEDYTIVVRNPNTTITQNMGNLIPSVISSLEIKSPRPNSQINQSTTYNIVDSLKFTSGVLNANGNDINLAGDIVVDTLNPFNQGSSTITFYDKKNQTIRGNNAVTLGSVVVNKDSNDIFVNTNTTFAGNTAITSETFINIQDNDTLTFGNASALTSGTGGFGTNRMIKVSGTPSLSGVVTKQYNNSSGTQSFTFPIGIDTLYNPGYVSLDGTYSGLPSISVQLINEKHPNRLNDLILDKYWTVSQNNITSLNTSEFRFVYNSPEDTNGNASRYYAGLYRPTNEWEVNLGPTPSAYPDTIKATNTLYFEGDWTAGESSTYFKGRNYYSRITGNWDIPLNWSNVNHSGPPSSYSPGELSQSDTVFIDGHTITFNVDTVTVDTITIGGTFGGVSTAGRGILNFAASPLDKHMTIQRSLFLDTDGRIQSATQVGKVDTLSIYERLVNNGTSANTAGIDLHNSNNDFVVLNFNGPNDSYLEGSGDWLGLSEVNLNKDGGLSDTLFINSATLGAASSSFVDYGFNLKSGILKHYNNYDFVAGNDGIGMNMEQFTGIVVTDGRLISNETVNTDVDNTIEIFGGEFVVGNAIDENFIYQDNTLVHLDGGKMTVAGAFDGDFLGATVRLNIENNSELKVLDKGATDIGLIGLNVNAGSQLDMASGRIIIANAIPGANADYKVNSAVGTGFTGGVVQIGDSTSSVGGSEIKIIGSTPIYDLHVVGSTITAKQTGATITVTNDLEIDNDAEYDVSTNSLSVGGNITNYGLFDASNGNIADFRLLTLNGSGDQTIFNDDAPGMSLHNLTIDKTGGKVILSGSGNSNLQIHRNLEFTAGNNAFIDGSANQFGQFVELSPLGGTNPAIIRNGKGHVYGRLYRHFTANATERLFVVGSDTIDSYRPALIKTANNGNTAGLIGVAHYGVDHPDLDPAIINTALNIQKYWNINTNGFALGSGNTYELKLDFLNPADIRNSANTNFFEQFMYDPACPAPPGLCPPGTGTWTELDAINKTTTSIRTKDINFYGDVVVGEPSGITFYSIANANWRLASSWSTDGYGGAPASRFPNLTSDIVRIGDNKRITMPAGILHDPVRAVIVEKYNGNPGELYILGNTGSLKASSFQIDDDCVLAFSNVGGITDNSTQGAIQTNTKSFGVANYIFKADNASMVSGKGFPDTLASVKVDLTDPTESVFTTNNIGSEPIKVRDSIIVDNGIYESGNRDFRLYGDFSQYTNGLWKPLLGNFLVAGPNTKTFRVGNADGLSFYDLDVTGGDITFDLLPSGGANTHMYVENELNLIDTTLIKVRADTRKVIIANGATVNRTGTGFVDGTMQRYFGAGVDSKQFAIGLNDIYTPVTVTTDNGSGGVAGGFDAIALEPVPKEPMWGNRLDTNKRIERFWKISAGDNTVDLGTRKFDTKFEFPSSELASIDETKAVIRRETLQPATFPIWYQRQKTDLQWNVGNADVELSATSLLWEDFGNFYIGEKPQRIFYSNSNGTWTDNASWAFDIGGTLLPPGGIYPNNDPTELDDIVIIDDSDEIELDTIPQVESLTIKDNSTFEIGLGKYVTGSNPTSTFDLQGGTIDNKSEFGIDSDDNKSWARFDNKTIDNDINFIFSGTTDQIFGNEFPTTIASLTINNSGPPGDNTVAIGDNDYTISGDLVITDGDLRHSADGNNLNLQGNLSTTEPLVLNEDINGTPICSDLTLQGSGATDQTISGPGALTFCDLNMDRGAGAGIGILNTPATVTGNVNLLVGANTNPQIFELGNGGNLSVTNSNPNAITGGSDGPLRYIRTSKTGGSLCRTVTTNGTYTWPVGSLEGGNDLYAPATLSTDASGADGDICLKTNVGSNTNPAGAHNEVSSDASDYIARYWEINSATTTITGQFVFNYNDLDIRGTEADYDRIGKWSEPGEGTPGNWTTYNNGIDLVNNTFSTPATFNPADMVGDWTLAELIAFRRIFYSRQTGNWTDPNSWTANSSHIGPIFATGVYPNLVQDSVVVGGGNAGVNDHVITLDVSGSVAIGGVALGTSSTNTGTLLTGSNIITGDYFTMGELSTLGVGSPDGITALGNATGNIQASVVRTFATAPLRTSFIYNGVTNQVTGNGLPINVENIAVNNSGPVSNNTVTFQSIFAVEGNMSVQQGVADINTQTATSDGTGTMSIDANAKLSISGTNNLLTSVNNYATYTLDINSIVEFYGSAQTISDLPVNLVSGLGYCILNNAGDKTVSAPLLIRRDLTIINDANLNNLVGVNSLQVNGSIINDAEITNQGIIEIGQ
ncbi:MAG: hypothetical protein KDC55_04425 [Ignavibacteriae bacterium]|nr:hypothetical protein [Ignavibacteriota bacterium]